MRLKRRVIFLAGFLFSIPVALTSYINSSLLESFVNPYLVSLAYILASLATIFGLLEMPKILIRRGNVFTINLFSVIAALSFVLLALGREAYIVIPAFILYFVSTNFIFVSLDIFLEDLSGNAPIGRLRGIYLTAINSAWVIAQLISGTIIARSSFSGIYLLSALFVLLVPIVITMLIRHFEDPPYKKISIWKTVRYFFKNADISKIYFLNLLLNFFFAWMVIYTPIYLSEVMGFSWDKIGLIFTIMLLPFVLLSFPLGRLSDKIGEKKMLRLGFAISAGATLLIPLVGAPNVLLFAMILFLTRIGAATIEIMTESYFFKIVRADDAEAISFFRNARVLSYIAGPLVAIVALALVPSFEFIFPILSVFLLFGCLLAGKIRDVK